MLPGRARLQKLHFYSTPSFFPTFPSRSVCCGAARVRKRPRCFGSGCQSRNVCSMFGLWLACAVLTGPLWGIVGSAGVTGLEPEPAARRTGEIKQSLSGYKVRNVPLVSVVKLRSPASPSLSHIVLVLLLLPLANKIKILVMNGYDVRRLIQSHFHAHSNTHTPPPPSEEGVLVIDGSGHPRSLPLFSVRCF